MTFGEAAIGEVLFDVLLHPTAVNLGHLIKDINFCFSCNQVETRLYIAVG
jgi:hypothetical protein